jgi:mycofactocin biosynthetic radical S-adenosylmethionine protein MftC
MYKTAIMEKIRQQRILHSVGIELTYHCNLDCFYCYNDREKKGSLLSLDQYRILLEDLAELQTLSIMLTGGEPMIHPHFFEIGRMTRDLGFITRIRTNGHSLNDRISARLKQEVDPYNVVVSLHGATPDVHDKQTQIPGSFDRLISNIISAKNAGLRVEAICTPTSWNEHQILDIYQLTDDLGIKLMYQGPVAPRDNGDLTPLQIQPRPETWNLINQTAVSRKEASTSHLEDKPSTETLDNNQDKQKDKQATTCGVGTGGVDIDPYGNVRACMHLQQSAGNIHEQSIKDIWASSPLFIKARDNAVKAAKQFSDSRPNQFGAPLYCLAVEENYQKGKNSQVVQLFTPS